MPKVAEVRPRPPSFLAPVSPLPPFWSRLCSTAQEAHYLDAISMAMAPEAVTPRTPEAVTPRDSPGAWGVSSGLGEWEAAEPGSVHRHGQRRDGSRSPARPPRTSLSPQQARPLAQGCPLVGPGGAPRPSQRGCQGEAAAALWSLPQGRRFHRLWPPGRTCSRATAGLQPYVPRLQPYVPRLQPGVPRLHPSVPRLQPSVPRLQPSVRRRTFRTATSCPPWSVTSRRGRCRCPCMSRDPKRWPGPGGGQGGPPRPSPPRPTRRRGWLWRKVAASECTCRRFPERTPRPS